MKGTPTPDNIIRRIRRDWRNGWQAGDIADRCKVSIETVKRYTQDEPFKGFGQRQALRLMRRA